MTGKQYQEGDWGLCQICKKQPSVCPGEERTFFHEGNPYTVTTAGKKCLRCHAKPIVKAIESVGALLLNHEQAGLWVNWDDCIEAVIPVLSHAWQKHVLYDPCEAKKMLTVLCALPILMNGSGGDWNVLVANRGFWHSISAPCEARPFLAWPRDPGFTSFQEYTFKNLRHARRFAEAVQKKLDELHGAGTTQVHIVQRIEMVWDDVG